MAFQRDPIWGGNALSYTVASSAAESGNDPKKRKRPQGDETKPPKKKKPEDTSSSAVTTKGSFSSTDQIQRLADYIFEVTEKRVSLEGWECETRERANCTDTLFIAPESFKAAESYTGNRRRRFRSRLEVARALGALTKDAPSKLKLQPSRKTKQLTRTILRDAASERLLRLLQIPNTSNADKSQHGLRLMSDGTVLSGDTGLPVPTSAADLEGTGENRSLYELVRVQCVGRLSPELDGCFSKLFLYPLGFRSARQYYSTRHTTSLSNYVSEIILSKDGKRPLFRVTELGYNKKFSYTATSPGSAWCGVLQAIERLHAQVEANTEMSLHTFKQEMRQYLPERDRHRNRPARQRARAEQLLPIGTVVTVDVSQDSNSKALGQCQGTLVQHSHGWYTVKLPSGQLIKRRRFRLKTDKESLAGGMPSLLSSAPTTTSPQHLAGADEPDLHADPLELEMNDSPDPYEDNIDRSSPPIIRAPSPAAPIANVKLPVNRRKRRRRNRQAEIPIGTAVLVDGADGKRKGVITGKCLGWYSVQLNGGREMKIRRSKLSVDTTATHTTPTTESSAVSPASSKSNVTPAADVAGESLATTMLLDTPFPDAVTMDEEADGDAADIALEDPETYEDAVGVEEDESDPETRPGVGVESDSDDAIVDYVGPAPSSPSKSSSSVATTPLTTATPASTTTATPASTTTATPASITTATPASVTTAPPAVTSSTSPSITTATPASVTTATPASITSATSPSISTATSPSITATPPPISISTPPAISIATSPATTTPTPCVTSPPELKQRQALALLPSKPTAPTEVLSPLTVPRQPSTGSGGNDASSDAKVRHPLEVPLSGQQIISRPKAMQQPSMSPHSNTFENALKQQTMWRAQSPSQHSKQPPTHPLISPQPASVAQSPSPQAETLSVPEQPNQVLSSPKPQPRPRTEEPQVNPDAQQPLKAQVQLQPEAQLKQSQVLQQRPQPKPQPQVQQVQAHTPLPQEKIRAPTLSKPQTQPRMQPLPQSNPIAIVAVAVSEAELEDDGTSVQLLPVASSVGAGSLEGALEDMPISNAVLESGAHSPAPLLDASLVTSTKAVLAVVEETSLVQASKATRPVAIAAAPAPAPAPVPAPAGVSDAAVIAEVVPSPVAAQKIVPATMPTTRVAAVPATTARVHTINERKHGGKQPRYTSVVEVVGDSSNSSAADKIVAALPQYIRDWYGEIVWTKRAGHPWWPGFVSDPRQLDPDTEIFDVAMSCIQTHFSIYYIDADDYAVVEHGSVRAWEEFMNTKFEETAAALPPPRREQLESAVARAMIEIHKPKESRLWCQHYLYTKKVEEPAQLREQKPYWTVVSATESRIRLRLVVPSKQTSEQIITEKPVVATVAPVAGPPVAIPTPPTPTPTAPPAPASPAPVDNSRAVVVAKEDPFIAHATQEIDTAEPASKKAKKGTKVQKKNKRKQSKEERSVRPASEPLDAKENFGLYMFGLSHPGWQTLMCGFSLVPKCEGFEGYIREQKRYKQRFERRVGVIEKKLHRTVFLALKNYKRLELKLMWYEDKLATEVNRKAIRDIREKVRQATKHVDLAVHMTDLREGAKRLWFRSNRNKETTAMPLPMDCDLDEVEELDISAGPPPLADLTLEEDLYTPMLPPPPLWNANERLRRDLMVQRLDMDALGSQCYELPPHLLSIYFPGVPADVVVSTCVEVVHFFKFFRGQLHSDQAEDHEDDDDADTGSKNKQEVVDMLKASLSVDAAPPPLTFRGFVEFVAKLNPGPTEHGSPVRQVLGDDDSADAVKDSIARVAPSFDRVMTRLLKLLLVSSSGAEETIDLMNWPEVLRRYIRCRYLGFIHLTHNNTPLPTSNTIESDDSCFLAEVTMSHLLALSAKPTKLANGPIVKPTQESATADAVKEHRQGLFTQGKQLLSNLERILRHELCVDEQNPAPSGTPGKTKESAAPQQVFVVTHKDALCLFGVETSCRECIDGDDTAVPFAHLAASRLLTRHSGKRLDEFKSPLRNALGWIHHMGGVEGKGNNASSVVRRVLQTTMKLAKQSPEMAVESGGASSTQAALAKSLKERILKRLHFLSSPQLLGSKSCRASRDGVLLTLHECEKAFALAICDGILSLVVRSDARCRDWFCVPIDEEVYPRYQQWVKRPMDLGLVANKLLSDKYASHEQFADDVRLVWSNCRTFNTETAEVVVLCNSLSSMFEQLYDELCRVLKRRQHSMTKSNDKIGLTIPADWPSFYLSSKSHLVQMNLAAHQAQNLVENKADPGAQISVAKDTTKITAVKQETDIGKDVAGQQVAHTGPGATFQQQQQQTVSAPEAKVEPTQETRAGLPPLPPALAGLDRTVSSQSSLSQTPRSVDSTQTPGGSVMDVEQVMRRQHHARADKFWALCTHLRDLEGVLVGSEGTGLQAVTAWQRVQLLKFVCDELCSGLALRPRFKDRQKRSERLRQLLIKDLDSLSRRVTAAMNHEGQKSKDSMEKILTSLEQSRDMYRSALLDGSLCFRLRFLGMDRHNNMFWFHPPLTRVANTADEQPRPSSPSSPASPENEQTASLLKFTRRVRADEPCHILIRLCQPWHSPAWANLPHTDRRWVRVEINSSEQSKRQIEYLMHYLQPNGSREAPIYFAIQRIFQVGQHFHSSFSPKIRAQPSGNAVVEEDGGVGTKVQVSGVKTKARKDWWHTVDAHAHARASTNVPLAQARVKQAKAMLLQIEADLPTHIFDSLTQTGTTAPVFHTGNKIWRLEQFDRVRQAWRAVVAKVTSPGDLVNALLLLEVGILPPFSLLWESFVDTTPSTSAVSFDDANTGDLMKDFTEAQMKQQRTRKRYLAEQVALVKSTHRTCASVCMRLRSLQDRVRAGVTAQEEEQVEQVVSGSTNPAPSVRGTTRSRSAPAPKETKTTTRRQRGQRKRKPSAKAASTAEVKRAEATRSSARSRASASALPSTASTTENVKEKTTPTRTSTRVSSRTRSSSQTHVEAKQTTRAKKSSRNKGFDRQHPLVRVRCKCEGTATRVLKHRVRRGIHTFP